MFLMNDLYWHPKMVKAVELMKGQAIHAQVFAAYVLGLAYAREHMTDGFLPQGAVEKLWKDCADGVSQHHLSSKSRPSKAHLSSKSRPSNGVSIGEVFSKKDVRLWHKRPNGWQIHDYLKYNPSALEIKTKREKTRERQRAWREQHGSLSRSD